MSKILQHEIFEKIKNIKGQLASATGKKYILNTSWLFGEQMLRMAVGLFIGVWVARYLGPEDFGLLSYAQSLVALFGAVATLGLNSIVVRELVKKEEAESNALLGTAFFLKLIGSLITFLFLWIAVSLTDTDFYTRLIVFLVASATIFQSLNVIDFYFQAKVQSKYVVYSNFFVLGVSSVLKVIFILIKAPLEFFALVFLIESIVLAVGLVVFFKSQRNNILKWQFDRSIALQLLKDSWPLILSSISVSIGMRVDQVMIKDMMDERSVGFYAVGVKLAEVFNFIPVIVSQSIFPKIVKMDFRHEWSKLVSIIRYIFFPLILMASGVNIISDFVVQILYGEDYLKSSGAFDILIWTVPFVFLNILTIGILQSQNYNKIVLLRQMTLALMNVGLNIFLIPKYGIIGASIATVAAEFSIIITGFLIPKERWIFKLRLQAMLFIPKKLLAPRI